MIRLATLPMQACSFWLPAKVHKDSFGLYALAFWAEVLVQPKKRKSWAKEFPPGPAMYAGLKSAYQLAFLFGKGAEEDIEREMYADFPLREAEVAAYRERSADQLHHIHEPEDAAVRALRKAIA